MAADKSQPSKNTDPRVEDVSWQAQKSAMTRDRILDAAINCFINLGYTNVTTAKVASTAGVSRGAMLHHFPSKTELIQAAVEYLHGKLLEDYTQRVNAIPKSKKGKAHRRADGEQPGLARARSVGAGAHATSLASEGAPVHGVEERTARRSRWCAAARISFRARPGRGRPGGGGGGEKMGGVIGM